MSFDVFAWATQSGANQTTVHNVRLIAVHPAEDGLVRMTIEHAGNTHELVGGSPFNEEWSRRDVGKVGYIVPASRVGRELPVGACHFRPYVDQSLQRVPELDSNDAACATVGGRRANIVGWICDTNPNGFRAPVGLIPGEGGQFVADETIEVTLRVPPEFVRECNRVQMSPEEVLRSFAGDLAGIHNFVVRPRADGYGSNGSDERDRAEAWLERAHGMNAIDLDALEQQRENAREKQYQRDDFAALLDDFEDLGGNADDLFAAVQALVDKQAKGNA
ncbi:hypothetical protein [Cupriavidus nantongensis]|uniref:hypothetical protein n=1 Tax=Cupriavidus nantongensis TaxID=1796606 RepID=UPI000AAC0E56|nr:hypothetical protein [Cupriavidus nantongensis]